MINFSTKTRAFTLVETLVAIAIILVVLVAPFQAVEKALGAAFAARDELIATALAQEGIEYIREVRVNNYLVSAPNWLTGVATAPINCSTTVSHFCTIDASPGAATPVALCTPSGANACSKKPLYLSNAGVYNQQLSGVATRFYRTIQLTPIVVNKEEEIISTVTWVSNHTTYTITLTDYINNWL